MSKFKAEKCKNFKPQRITPILEEELGGAIHFVCITIKCVDRSDCDGEVKEIMPDVHFETKE